MASDSHSNLVLFGGLNIGGYMNDTWTWDGTNWTQQAPAHTPSVRGFAAMAYQQSTGQTVLFGGIGGDPLGDTWIWNGTDWAEQTPATSPGARTEGALASSSNGQLVLFGGYSSNLLTDTWTWNGTNWTEQSPAAHPGPRYAAAMAYSASANQTVLFGGGLNNGGFLNDTWVWDGTNWTEQALATSPSARVYLDMAYSANSGQIVLFGGQGTAGRLNDTWSWNGHNWTQLSPVTSPGVRSAAAIAATGDEVVLFGGTNGTPLNDAWTLNLNPNAQDTTTPTLTSSPNPSSVGQPVVFTATVTSTTSAPTGSVSFLDGTNVIGTATLIPGNGVSSTGTFTTSSLSVGPHAIAAAYTATEDPGSPAHPDTFAWTNWTLATPGDATPGTAVGTLASTLYGSIDVTYSGQTSGLATQPSWGPASTFTGGIVGNGPPAYNGLALEGGYNYTETITFSHAVTDPAFAIWSLGSPSVPAYFNFTAAEPFNLLGGGPNSEYGGQSIVIAGTAIDGMEGNGIVQFIGTYNSLTFTTPDYEDYYALTVGEDQTLTDNPPISATLNQVVTPDTTTTAVTSSPNPSIFGQTVIFTATVTSSFAAPVGTVSFLDGTNVIGTATLVPGSSAISMASFSTSSLTVGTHPITAAYAATENFAAATSSVLSQKITKGAATFGTMTFSPSAAESVGTAQTITISDTLSYSGAQPTGAVAYVLNGVTYTAACTTTGSPETCAAQVPAATIAALSVGPYTVSGSFAGDSFYSSATAASGIFAVTAAGACTIPNSPSGSMNITYYTLAESDRDGNDLPNGLSSDYVLSSLGANGLPVSNPNPTATNGGVAAPKDLLADGEITWWSSALNNGGSGGSSDVVQTGTGIVQLPFSNADFYPPNGAGPNDFNGFQTAVLTGTLVAATTESVGFTIASDDMAFVYLDGQIACDDGGVHGPTPVPCTTSTIAAGTHTLQLFYADLNTSGAALDFSLTTSNAAVGAGNQLVFGTMTFSPAATEPEGTSQTITISDTLTYSGPAPTGAVAYALNGVSYPATCTTAGSPETCTTQVPAATIAALQAGVYTVMGSFAGDCNYSKAAATSGTFTITPAPTKTTTTLTASATSLTFGQQLVLTASVSSSTGGVVTGTATFLNGTATLGTATLNGAGVATLTLTPAVGIYSVTVSYSGSTNNLPSSSSPAIVITVTQAPTLVTLTSSLNPAPGGSPVTFNIAVHAGGETPTGQVTLSDAGTLLATLFLSANGTAAFTTSSLAIGSHLLTASYAGNASFIAGQAMLTQVILPPPDFSISTGGPLTLVTQHHGPVTVSVTPINDFSGDVTLSCGTLPPYARCEWGKPTATQTAIAVAGGVASTQIIIDTSAVINYLASSRDSSDSSQSSGRSARRFALAGFMLPAMFLLFRIRRAKTAVRLMLCVFVLGSMLHLSGCSSRYPDSTPPGTYSIEIDGSSGTIQHSAVLTLVVTE